MPALDINAFSFLQARILDGDPTARGQWSHQQLVVSLKPPSTMGIPHLIATLEPFAEQLVLKDEKVVIDGPALAYHILYVCRAHGLIDPSYDAIGRTLIKWLDELEKNGVIIQHAYFDGYLPPSKQSVRMERLVKSTFRVDDFFKTNPKGCRGARASSGGLADFDVFELANTAAIKPPPDPSFLVPAAIDALRSSSRYRALFSIVPGEADAYCARHIALHGGMVMTSDSDLLAHDLGLGRVVFLREIHRNANDGLSCMAFCPQEIYEKLALPASIEPWRFAYERKRSSNATLSRLVKACSLPIMDLSDYENFRRQYLHPEDGQALLLKSSGKGTLQLNGLDPRFSELILQLKHGSIDPKICLPIMIENPLRGTVWEPSMPTRQLAYTIAAWMLDCSSSLSVYEYRRVRQRDQKGRQVDLMLRGSLPATIRHLVSLIERIRKELIGKSENDHWIYLSLILDVIGCEEQGKNSYLLEMLRQGYTPSSKLGDRLPWDILHFAAQLQAGLYSLRILSQVLSLATSHSDDGDERFRSLQQLRQCFIQFPSLLLFTDAIDSLKFLGGARRDQALRMVERLANVADSSSPQMVHEPQRAKKPNNRKDGKKAELKRPSPAPHIKTKTNMFSLLSMDKQ